MGDRNRMLISRNYVLVFPDDDRYDTNRGMIIDANDNVDLNPGDIIHYKMFSGNKISYNNTLVLAVAYSNILAIEVEDD